MAGGTVMTQEEKAFKIAEVCGHLDRWLIVKAGYYYRPQGAGYTSSVQEAWIVPESVADRHVYPHDTPVTKKRAPLLDYFNSLDACHKMEEFLSDDQYNRFCLKLTLLCSEQYYELSANRHWSADAISARPEQRAEAFGQVLKLWKEGE
jgi:hypothetical protein